MTTVPTFAAAAFVSKRWEQSVDVSAEAVSFKGSADFEHHHLLPTLRARPYASAALQPSTPSSEFLSLALYFLLFLCVPNCGRATSGHASLYPAVQRTTPKTLLCCMTPACVDQRGPCRRVVPQNLPKIVPPSNSQIWVSHQRRKVRKYAGEAAGNAERRLPVRPVDSGTRHHRRRAAGQCGTGGD
ncbi:hypothetical protein B0H19DRAFT_1060209 [Mycena capillaripes]|nr:hypothetical protein B0H19DRAFT_1060209 [Mycena capillaripes]